MYVAIMCVYRETVPPADRPDEPHVYNTWAREYSRLRGLEATGKATGDLPSRIVSVCRTHRHRTHRDRQRHSIYNVLVATSTVRPPLPLAPFRQ
jgi:hypothetical protein